MARTRALLAFLGLLIVALSPACSSDAGLDGERVDADVPNATEDVDAGSADEVVTQTCGTAVNPFVSAWAQSGRAVPERASNDSGDQAQSSTNSSTSRSAQTRSALVRDEQQLLRDGNHLAILNEDVGVQMVDISQPANPRVVGQVRVVGWGGKIFRVGDHIYLVTELWSHFHEQSPRALFPDRHSSSVIIAIDVSDPTRPTVEQRTTIDGFLYEAELVRDGSGGVLVLAGRDQQSAYVKSFAVSGQGEVRAVDEHRQTNIDDVRVDDGRIALASFEGTSRVQDQVFKGKMRFTVVDVDASTGELVAGEPVQLQELTRRYHGNLSLETIELRDDRLHVTYAGPAAASPHYFETFDVSTLSDLRRVEHRLIAAETANVDAVHYLDAGVAVVTIDHSDSASPVTRARIYGFDDAGRLDPQSTIELEPDAWVRPVANDTQLLSVSAHDDTRASYQEKDLKIRIYDVTSSSQDAPAAGAEAVLDSSVVGADIARLDWGGGSWVLDDAVDVRAPGGEKETDLLAVRFGGHDEERNSHVGLIKLFSFSESTITPRGIVDVGTYPSHVFQPVSIDGFIAAVSSHDVSLFDVSELGSPSHTGRVELSPDFHGFEVVAGHGLRRRSTYRQGGGMAPSADPTRDTLEVFDLTQEPSITPTLATFEVNRSTAVYTVGDLLVRQDVHGVPNLYRAPHQPTVDLEVWNLSEPTEPTRQAKVTTERLDHAEFQNYDYNCDDCFRTSGAPEGFVVGEAIVYRSIERFRDPSSADSSVSTGYRRRARYHFQVLDLSDPANPHVASEFSMPQSEDDIGLRVEGETLFITHKEHVGNGLAHVSYYYKRVDLSDPSSPKIGPSISIPGEIIDVRDDTLLTHDVVWGEEVAESAVRRVQIEDDTACIQASRRYRNREVRRVSVDGSGSVLVYHRQADAVSGAEFYEGGEERVNYLSLLDANSVELSELRHWRIDRWASFQGASKGRAIFGYDGALFINIEDPQAPYTEAYLPDVHFPSSREVPTIRIAAGGLFYGVHRLNSSDAHLFSQ